jgi:hypothetical protein
MLLFIKCLKVNWIGFVVNSLTKPDSLVCQTELSSFSSSAASSAKFQNRLFTPPLGNIKGLSFTRTALAYAVQQICLHMHDLQEPHLTAMKRTLRYLQETLEYSLLLRRSASFELTFYTDVDWAGCPDTRRSTSGYAVFLNANLVS